LFLTRRQALTAGDSRKFKDGVLRTHARTEIHQVAVGLTARLCMA
jgi:hypothetical protein